MSYDGRVTAVPQGAKLGVTLVVSRRCLHLALPERPGARGVVVRRRRTEALLLAVVAPDVDLQDGADEEEDGSDDGDSEAGGLEPARETEIGEIGRVLARADTESCLAVTGGLRVCGAATEWGADGARARAGAVAEQHGHGDEGGDEEEVEDDGEEGEEGLPAQEAGEQDGEDEVQTGGAGDGLNGFGRSADDEIAVGEHGEEVGEDGEDQAGAAELDGVEERLGDSVGSRSERSSCDATRRDAMRCAGSLVGRALTSGRRLPGEP